MLGLANFEELVESASWQEQGLADKTDELKAEILNLSKISLNLFPQAGKDFLLWPLGNFGRERWSSKDNNIKTNLSRSPELDMIRSAGFPATLVGSSDIKLLPLILNSFGEFLSNRCISKKVRIVPHSERAFNIVWDLEELGDHFEGLEVVDNLLRARCAENDCRCVGAAS